MRVSVQGISLPSRLLGDAPRPIVKENKMIKRRYIDDVNEGSWLARGQWLREEFDGGAVSCGDCVGIKGS